MIAMILWNQPKEKTMKKIIIILLLIATPVHANFYAGFLSSFLVHEGGHQVSATSLNERIDWQLTGDTRIVTARFSDDAYPSDLAWMASGGIIAQHICNEILLECETSDFRRGLFWGNVLTPAIYALDHLYIHKLNKNRHGVAMGDYAVIDDNYGHADRLAYASLAFAAWQAFKMTKHSYLPCYVWAEPEYVELVWEISF